MDGRTDGWTDRWMGGWMDKWLDRRTDGWTDGQMNIPFHPSSTPAMHFSVTFALPPNTLHGRGPSRDLLGAFPGQPCRGGSWHGAGGRQWLLSPQPWGGCGAQRGGLGCWGTAHLALCVRNLLEENIYVLLERLKRLFLAFHPQKCVNI